MKLNLKRALPAAGLPLKFSRTAGRRRSSFLRAQAWVQRVKAGPARNGFETAARRPLTPAVPAAAQNHPDV